MQDQRQATAIVLVMEFLQETMQFLIEKLVSLTIGGMVLLQAFLTALHKG